MGKYCCFGTCVSDERLGRPGYDISTRFYPFPKPCGEYKYEASEWTPEEEKTHILNCKKCGICRDWMFHCRRKDSKFQSLKNITRNTYICSKHFEGHFEALDHEVHRPMSYFPVNLSQRRKGKKRSRLSHDFEGEFSEENDVEQNRRATSLNANSNTNVRSANTMADTFQFDEENDAVEDQEMEVEPCASDEDTEEASESEQRPEIPHIPQSIPDFKEQIFQEKLNSLKAQLQSLIDGTNSEYLRKVKKLELLYNERLRMNKIMREHELELTEKDYIAETRAASKEFDDKMVELKENLIQDMEEKRRTIEVERLSMELSGDSTETKPAMTRKLRRRPNDPAPVPEKRRGKIATLPSQVNLLLDEKDIESDLKALSRGIKANASIRKPANGLQALGPVIPDNLSSSDIRVEDGKLLYERKWFHRGQTVFIEGKDMPKFPAIISAIGSEAISVKKTGDSAKVRIYMNQLIRGKVSIKRRAS